MLLIAVLTVVGVFAFSMLNIALDLAVEKMEVVNLRGQKGRGAR